MNRKYAQGDALHAAAVKKFSRWPNARVGARRVPESLEAMRDSRSVAYASIDMNVPPPRRWAAAEFLWPRLAPGAPVLLDDYGWAAHGSQKKAWDGFARSHGVMVLWPAHRQGLIVKPA